MIAGRSSAAGLVDGVLRPCPDSPNCVCSQQPDESHWVPPLEFDGPPEPARRRLVEVLRAMPRARVVTEDETYLHCEFRSAIFRFVDDVEFLIDEEAGLIHVRSASRVGYSDLGVNRKRVERIRTRFLD